AAVVDEEGSLDFRHVFGGGLAPVEGHGGGDDLGETDRESRGKGASETEADDPDLAAALGMDVEPLRCGDEVFGDLVRVEFRLQGAAVVVVAGIAAEGGESIGGVGEVTGEPESAGDI